MLQTRAYQLPVKQQLSVISFSFLVASVRMHCDCNDGAVEYSPCSGIACGKGGPRNLNGFASILPSIFSTKWLTHQNVCHRRVNRQPKICKGCPVRDHNWYQNRWLALRVIKKCVRIYLVQPVWSDSMSNMLYDPVWMRLPDDEAWQRLCFHHSFRAKYRKAKCHHLNDTDFSSKIPK